VDGVCVSCWCYILYIIHILLYIIIHILLYIILYIILLLYSILYIILYSSSYIILFLSSDPFLIPSSNLYFSPVLSAPSSSSDLSSLLPFRWVYTVLPSFPSIPPPFLSIMFSSHLIHSILVGTYIYLFIFFSSSPNLPPSSSHPPLLYSHHTSTIHILGILVGTYIYLFIFIFLFLPLSSSSQYSFYTCRYLHILIYIIPILF
jgi:hypothetical protein